MAGLVACHRDDARHAALLRRSRQPRAPVADVSQLHAYDGAGLQLVHQRVQLRLHVQRARVGIGARSHRAAARHDDFAFHLDGVECKPRAGGIVSRIRRRSRGARHRRGVDFSRRVPDGARFAAARQTGARHRAGVQRIVARVHHRADSADADRDPLRLADRLPHHACAGARCGCSHGTVRSIRRRFRTRAAPPSE